MGTESVDQRRIRYDSTVAALVGQTVEGVRYSDVHNYGPARRVWDFSDWHSAVMGLEIATPSGPFAILATPTYYNYGVDVFAQPIEAHLRHGETGPDVWDVATNGQWARRLHTPIRGTETLWDTMEFRPAIDQDGTRVSDARADLVPIVLRLDFDHGPVWFVAAMPDLPTAETTFFGPADEIVVAFSVERLKAIGIRDVPFLADRTRLNSSTGGEPDR